MLRWHLPIWAITPRFFQNQPGPHPGGLYVIKYSGLWFCSQLCFFHFSLIFHSTLFWLSSPKHSGLALFPTPVWLKNCFKSFFPFWCLFSQLFHLIIHFHWEIIQHKFKQHKNIKYRDKAAPVHQLWVQTPADCWTSWRRRPRIIIIPADTKKADGS